MDVLAAFARALRTASSLLILEVPVIWMVL
jgi:hypothetical protein